MTVLSVEEFSSSSSSSSRGSSTTSVGISRSSRGSEGVAIVDGGSNRTLSRLNLDFAEPEEGPRVRLCAANGSVPESGFVGALRSNSLGLSAAVFFPALPVARIISSRELNLAMWSVHLCPGRKWLESHLARETIRPHESKGLPTCRFEFRARRLADSLDEDLASANSGTSSFLCKRALGSTALPRACFSSSEPLVREVAGPASADCLLSKLALHRLLGHFYSPEVKLGEFACPDCCLGKGEKVSPAKVRPMGSGFGTGFGECSDLVPLRQLDADFYGPIRPKSVRKCAMSLVFICDAVSFVWLYPIRHRDEAVETADKLVEELRASDGLDASDLFVQCVRSDNEIAVRGGQWLKALRELRISPTFATPCNPSVNGVTERWMGSFGSNLRTVLVGVDPLLRCYAGEFLAYVWSRISRKYSRASSFDGLAPLQARERRRTRAAGADRDAIADAMRRQREEWLLGLRRFGCLAFVLTRPRELLPKAVPGRKKAVFPGFRSLNSACAFGSCVGDDRCKLSVLAR